MTTRVKRADGKVWIEGMEGVNWGGSFFTREDSQVRCLVEALRCAGRDVSYADVMGLSGAAFKLTMEPTLFVAEIHSEMGMDWKEIMSRVWGLDYSWEAISCSDEENPGWRQQLHEAAVESVGRGMPLFYMNGEWNLLVGYLEDGSGLICKPYAGDERGYREMATPGGFVGDIWFASVLRPSGEPADRRDSVVRSLQTALELAGKPAESDGKRLFGKAAYEAWIAAVESGGDDVSLHGNAFSYSQLLTSRQAAAEYLRSVAAELGGDAAPHVRAAADRYQAIYQRLWDGRQCVTPPWEENWTPENRAKEATILRDRLADEKAAVAEIEAALRALSGTPTGAATMSTDRPGTGPQEDATPKRFVLEGVPKVAYHTDRWRFTPFCNALDACLQYLGQEEQYDYLMCTSGAMFRMTWMPKAWDGGNSDILGMASESLEPMRRAFWSAGYRMAPVAKAEPAGWPEDILRGSAQRLGGELTDEAGFRRRIVESINAGLPVIAFGVIGPPEACVITGYDESGDVLLGWNVFQDDEGAETEPSGYFRVRDWYEKTRALLLIGDNVGRPDSTELDRETLKWALQVLRTPRVRSSQTGPAAFDAWAADMLNDEYFPEGKTGVLRARLMCHWDSMTVTATRGSGSATPYLLAVAEREPAMAGHLQAAADCLDREDVVHGVAPGEEAHMARLADPAVRRQVADSILHARDMHVEAADHIERALLAAGVPPEDIPRPEPQATDEGKDPAERIVLEGVPKVGFGMIDGHVAMTPFPACLRACLEYMGDDLGFGTEGKYPRDAVYAYLMGMTGAAFRLDWKPGWHGDNVASWLLSDDPSEIFRRGFAAAGYEQIPSGHIPPEDRQERFRSMVIESIRDRGLPLIAHGIIGPPEEAIIAGYDEGGRVAIGWSFFQDDAIGKAGVEFEPNGYFRKRRWEADTWSMMAIGEKTERPEPRTAYVGALQWALRVVREPVRHGNRHNGLAAYDAWAEHILRDDGVAAGGRPDDAFMVHSDATTTVAEGRWYASLFLRQAADVLPEAKDDLLAAADCYKAEHDLMWQLWGILGSNVPGDAERQEFLKPDVRRSIVPIIRQSRDKDAEAADHIEKALLALGS